MRTKLDGPYAHINCICIGCKHYGSRKDEKAVCKAFPKGIPLEIWNGKVDHFNSYPEDNGIVYEEDIEDDIDLTDLELIED